MNAPQKDVGPCPDAERLVQFARGLLEGETHATVLDHARGCEECGSILAAFTRAPSPREPPAKAIDAIADTAFAFGSVATGPGGATGIQLGELIDQKYRVKELIGAGGMGVVVAATHVQIGHTVALKFMRPEACHSTEGVARFVREARASAQLQSEHVAKLLDVGRLDGGEPYMVMELLRGQDLGELLRTKGPLPLEDAVDYVLQAGEAVAEAHRLGIVHRDLKPANLFLSQRPDGTPLVKVLDFGISKLGADSLDGSVGLTGSRTVIGSPRYMSPEQLSSPRGVGQTTDVWAFGCILYELVTGEPAFTGETMHSVGVAIATKPAPKARARRSDLPRLLDDVIAGCLVKDPAARIQSVADLALALAPLAPPRSRISVERICRLTNRPPPIGASTGAGTRRAGQILGSVAVASVLAAVAVIAGGGRTPASPQASAGSGVVAPPILPLQPTPDVTPEALPTGAVALAAPSASASAAPRPTASESPRRPDVRALPATPHPSTSASSRPVPSSPPPSPAPPAASVSPAQTILRDRK